MSTKPIPVILDTDIGGDIDDAWALALLLRSPELDLKLVAAATGNTTYRAKNVAKMLEIAGRTDIPVGIAAPEPCGPERDRVERWLTEYDLDRYPGTVHRDGAQALIDAIRAAPDGVTLISIGPLPNVAEALRRAPDIAPKTRFVGMHGSLRRHHDGKDGAIAEFNVERNIPAAQAVFAAPWKSVVITPLDTCGVIRLRGEKYKAVANSSDPLTRSVIEQYRIWLGQGNDSQGSSILYDTVAVFLAFSTDWLAMKRMKIAVTDDGFTRESPAGKPMDVAVDWTDLAAYEDFLVRRLAR